MPAAPIAFLTTVALLVLLARAAKAKRRSPVVRAKRILTDNETEFYYRLQRALPHYHVLTQVSFAAFLTSAQAHRGFYSQKIADFVVCEPQTMKVLAIVELDDRTHNAAKDAKRDKMLSSAGYRTIRFHSKRKPSETEITVLFSPADASRTA
jgi:very-short-patch-repair endonuclease